MASTPLADIVSQQYSRWMYPEPIVDLPQWLENHWQWFDPSHSHRLFWPDQDYQPDMDILVAGCGTNQAAVIAHTNPQSRVLAIDVSGPSLRHHEFLKSKYQLGNLELRQLPIEDLVGLRRDFDLIVSTGVLHHLASPVSGMQSLARCLRPDGVAALMLYARHGRTGVSMLQAAFRELGLGQDEASVALVRDALGALPSNHPAQSYLELAPDLRSDAGLVDTFLHGRERAYEIGDCIALVESAGLVFQDLFFQAPYHPPPGDSGAFLQAVSTLPRPRQWSVMERFHFENACHFFLACRPERSPVRYAIDFSRADAREFVPSWRYRCHLDGNHACRPDWSLALGVDDAVLLGRMDGRRTLGDLEDYAARHKLVLPEAAHGSGSPVAALIAQLWRLDLITVGLPRLSRLPRLG